VVGVPPFTVACLAGEGTKIEWRSEINRPCKVGFWRHGGAPGLGAPRGNKNALKHRQYTREALAELRRVRRIIRESRAIMKMLM
jgi:hypothetical protein